MQTSNTKLSALWSSSMKAIRIMYTDIHLGTLAQLQTRWHISNGKWHTGLVVREVLATCTRHWYDQVTHMKWRMTYGTCVFSERIIGNLYTRLLCRCRFTDQSMPEVLPMVPRWYSIPIVLIQTSALVSRWIIYIYIYSPGHKGRSLN